MIDMFWSQIHFSFQTYTDISRVLERLKQRLAKHTHIHFSIIMFWSQIPFSFFSIPWFLLKSLSSQHYWYSICLVFTSGCHWRTMGKTSPCALSCTIAFFYIVSTDSHIIVFISSNYSRLYQFRIIFLSTKGSRYVPLSRMKQANCFWTCWS